VYDWRMAQRDFYVDRLRSVMTVLVILHHTAITYGAPGGWFWTELKPSGSLSSILLTLFVTTNQAYFMGFFFLLAGYFTPASLERKGYARFICDRFLRLGLPLLAFGLFLGPLTDVRLPLAAKAFHQRAAMVCAGTAYLQPRLLRVAVGCRRTACWIPTRTKAGSGRALVALERVGNRCGRAGDSSVRSNRR